MEVHSVTHSTTTVEHFQDGGTIRLSDCHVEYSTITADKIEVGELR